MPLLSVDRLRGLHLRATDLVCGRPIVFHHVPKCGGTSIGRALRRAYILSQGTVKPIESAKAFEAAQHGEGGLGNLFHLREMMLLYLFYCDTRCIAAHVPFSNAAFERFADRYAFVTMLRDPVARLISKYYWNTRHLGDDVRSAESLGEYLASEEARGTGATYVRYFSGSPDRQRGTPANVEAAIRNLRRMSYVGFLDEVPNFQSALRTLTGRRISIGKENVGTARSSQSRLVTPELRSRIEAICSPDREIWEAVQDLRRAEPRRRRASETEKSQKGPTNATRPTLGEPEIAASNA